MKQVSDIIRSSIQARVINTLTEQKQSYKKIQEGKPLDAEDNEDRKIAFIRNKVDDLPVDVLKNIANYVDPQQLDISSENKAKAESIQGSTIDFMGVYFLDLAKAASRSVARVIFQDGRPEGSGFMISPSLFLTNNHVISTIEQANGFLVEFDYEEDYRQVRKTSTIFKLNPQGFFKTAPRDDLDFTIVAVGEKVSGPLELKDIGFIPLFESNDKHIKGIFVNCIQHPNGNLKQLVVRENRLLARTTNTLIYSSDTMPGSSGSPVFNDNWEVIALHHWGQPYRALTDDTNDLPQNGNEGIRISSIVKYLRADNSYTEKEKKLLEEVFSYQFRQPSLIIQPVANEVRKEEKNIISRAPAVSAEQPVNTKNATSMDNQSTNTAVFTIPLTLTVSIGNVIAVTQQQPVPQQPGSHPDATAGIAKEEKLTPDENYSNRKGYNPAFLGTKIPLPVLTASQKKNAARNLKAKAGDDPYEFKYQHFSVVMNAKRRLAYFTAVNIDGGSVVKINRETGKVTRGPESIDDGAEGREKWYADDRIDENEVCEDKLYTDEPKMRVFQRGHLVKRTDPSWGTEAKAIKGQADTFHFTNCAPQHQNFNPKKNRWAGVEDWITNTSDDENIRVTVFSGPVFTEKDPQVGYVKIPKAFWKIIVWPKDGELNATAIIADQSKLLKSSGLSVGESLTGAENFDEFPDNLPAEYRCSVKYLEKITKLDFGKLSAIDTYKSGGGESITLIEGTDDLL